MPKSKEQYEELKNERKKMIARAALKMFCVKSYEGTQISDIAREAEISHGLIYHYFKDKQEIFEYIHSENGKKISDTINKICEKNTANTEKLVEIAEFFMNFKEKDKFFPFQFFAFISKRFQDINVLGINGEFHHKKGGVFGTVYKILEDGKESGEFDFGYSVRQAALLFWAAVQGSNLGYILCPEEARNTIEPLNPETLTGIFTKNKKGE